MQKKHTLATQSIFTFLLVLSGLFLPHQRDTAHTHRLSAAASRPPDGYGIYESCDPHRVSICDGRLNNIAAGGFSEVMDYSAFSSDTTISDIIAYAAYAHQVGMKVIWPVDDFINSNNNATDVLSRYPTLVHSINSSGLCSHSVNTNYWLIACITIITTDHYDTWGYYIGDELPASDEPNVRHLVDAILDWNRDAPRMFMAQDLGGQLNSSQVNAYGRSYHDSEYAVADANVIAQDYYPIGTGQQNGAASYTRQIAASLDSFARSHDISYGIALQAHSLSEYKSTYPLCTSAVTCPYPTASQEQSMLSAVLDQGDPRIVMWYSYFDLLNSHNYMKHWTDLTAVIGGLPEPSTDTTPKQPHCLLESSAARCLSGQEAPIQPGYGVP